LARVPLPGRHGELVLAHTCAKCWEEWKGVQVKLINEYRLNVMEPDHYAALMGEMQTFLNLPEEQTAEG
jgi:Fe-S cluster biosynthesis and repair protein YggX